MCTFCCASFSFSEYMCFCPKLQGCFPVEMISLPQCQWCEPDIYIWVTSVSTKELGRHIHNSPWVAIGSDNGLLTDGTKPLPEPILTYHQYAAAAFNWGQSYKRYLSHQSLKQFKKFLNFIQISHSQMSYCCSHQRTSSRPGAMLRQCSTHYWMLRNFQLLVPDVNKHAIPHRTNGSLVSLNPLRATFFRGNINIYLHFMSFLHTNIIQVVEIPPRVRQGPAYST